MKYFSLRGVILMLFAVTVVFSVSPVYSQEVATDLPDLVISSVTFVPKSPQKGEWCAAQIIVTNQGPGRASFRAGQTVVRVKPPFGSSVPAEADFTMEPKSSRMYTINDVINPNNPSAPPVGNYWVEFTVDPDNVVAETNKNNNTLRETLFVVAASQTSSATAAPTGTYDLAVDSFRVDPPKGTTSTEFLYILVVRNVGNTPARFKTAAFDDHTKIGGGFQASVGTLTVGDPTSSFGVTLNPGQTYEFRTKPMRFIGGQPSATLPEGLLIITATVNDNELSNDLNPSNNVRSVTVEVVNPNKGSVGKPNLLIDNLYATTYEISAGEPLIMSKISVSNFGDAPAFMPAGSVVLKAEEFGKILATTVINKEWYAWVNQPFLLYITIPADKLSPGLHNITLTVDPNNAAGEKSMSDKAMPIKVNVRGPDLAVTAVTATPLKPTTSDTIQLDVTVKNLATMDAVIPQGAFFLFYGAQTFKTSTLTLQSNLKLTPGQEYHALVAIPPFTPNAGNYNIVVTVDPDDKLYDPNRSNNSFTLPVVVAAPAIRDAVPASSKPMTPATPSTSSKTPPVKPAGTTR
jgi:hypothetical protein